MASTHLVCTTSVVLIIFAGLLLFFVFRGAKRTKNIADYAVGSFHFSPVAVGLSLAATLTSAATFVINPGFVSLYGVSALIAYGLAIPAGIFISLIILTKSFRKFGSSEKALTMAQWIGKRFESKSFAFYFGLLSILLITFMVLICVSMTKVLSKALNADEVYVLIVIVGFVFGYMMFGGINAMVYTNVIQGSIMILVAVILLGSGYEHFSNGVHSILEKLAEIDTNLTRTTYPGSPFFRDNFEIIFCNFIIGLAAVCQPHIITRSLVLKKESDVNKFLTVAILIEVLFFAVLITGIYVRLYFPDLMAEGEQLGMDDLIPSYVVKEFPVYLSIVVIIGLLSAGLSTLEGLIQSIPTSITLDIIEPVIGKNLGSGRAREKKITIINKVVIAVVAIVTFFLTKQQLNTENISVAIFAQNGVYAYFSAAFIPVLFGIFLKDVPRYVVMIPAVLAVIIHFSVYYGRIGSYMQEETNNPAVAATYAIIIAFAVGLGLYVFSRARARQIA
ncbi:MAG: sodium:solute symporter [Bacteroidetes bacterium]|nr:MAG: sodium:solute symporter [Bacteroidota bacterium]